MIGMSVVAPVQTPVTFSDVARDRPRRAGDLTADLEAISSRNDKQDLANLTPDLHGGLPDFEIAMTSNDVVVGHGPTIAEAATNSATIRTRAKPQTLNPQPSTLDPRPSR